MPTTQLALNPLATLGRGKTVGDGRRRHVSHRPKYGRALRDSDTFRARWNCRLNRSSCPTEALQQCMNVSGMSRRNTLRIAPCTSTGYESAGGSSRVFLGGGVAPDPATLSTTAEPRLDCRHHAATRAPARPRSDPGM